jgi:hypothetical protein
MDVMDVGPANTDVERMRTKVFCGILSASDNYAKEFTFDDSGAVVDSVAAATAGALPPPSQWPPAPAALATGQHHRRRRRSSPAHPTTTAGGGGGDALSDANTAKNGWRHAFVLGGFSCEKECRVVATYVCNGTRGPLRRTARARALSLVFPQYTLYVDWNVVLNTKLSNWRLITVNGQLCLIHASAEPPPAQSPLDSADDGDSSTAVASSASTPAHSASVDLSPQSSWDSSTAQHSAEALSTLRRQQQQQQRNRASAAAEGTLSLASALASVVGGAKTERPFAIA